MASNPIKTYLDLKLSVLHRLAETDPKLALFAATLRQISTEDIRRASEEPRRPTKRDLLKDPVLKKAIDNIPATSEAGNGLKKFSQDLDWSIVFHGIEAPTELRETMHVAALAYRPQTDNQRGIHTGIFMLHPHLDYPLHSHVANEIYVCLSGHLSIVHGTSGARHDIGPGEYSVTPSECVHSLHTGEDPVILSYVWEGELSAPNWWWHKNETGAWQRERWQWADNYEWQSHGIEPVTADILRRANP